MLTEQEVLDGLAAAGFPIAADPLSRTGENVA